MTGYQDKQSHRDIENNKCECDNMENMETYSEEVKIGKKKVKITLEFPKKTEPEVADKWERLMKESYLNAIKEGAMQMSLNAVSFPTLEGKSETSPQGGMSHE